MAVQIEPLPRPQVLAYSEHTRSHHANPGLSPLMRGLDYRPNPSAPLWQQALDVSLARCEGVWRRHPTATALSGLSAALLHGLWVGAAEPDAHLLLPKHPGRSCTPLPAVRFTDPRDGRRRPGRRDVKLHKRQASLEPQELSLVNGLPVTSLLRTAVDCAFDEPARLSLPVVDSAVRALVTPDRFDQQASDSAWRRVHGELLEAVAAQGSRRGARRARLVTQLASPWSESYGESVLRWQVAALGLPEPMPQQRLDVEGQVYFLDLGWPQFAIGAEYDGTGKYGQVRAAWDEKVRQDQIRRHSGVELFRFTARHLAEPALLRRDVLAMFPLEVAATARPVAHLCR